MSRGPGKWQRLILSELAGREAFFLRELREPKRGKAQYNALLRAMQELEAAGKINVTRYAYGGRYKTVVHRVFTTFTPEDYWKLRREDGISVGQRRSSDLANTYSDKPKRSGASDLSRRLRDMANVIDAEVIREEEEGMTEGCNDGKT